MPGSGAGHISAMISSLKANDAHLSKKGRIRNQFFDIREAYRKVAEKRAIKFRTASKDELALVRAQVIAAQKIRKVKVLLLFAVAMIAVGLVAFWGINLWLDIYAHSPVKPLTLPLVC